MDKGSREARAIIQSSLFLKLEISLIRALMLAFLSVLLPRFVAAQSVPFLGAQLPVNALSEVDSEQVAVQVGGGAFIAKKDELGRKVASVYASHPDLARGLPWDAYAQMIGRAAQQGEGEVARAATKNFLESPSLADQEIQSLVSALLSSGEGIRILRELVSEISPETTAPTRAMCDSWLALSTSGASHDPEQGAALVPWAQRGCLEQSISRALSLLKKGDLDDAQPYLRSISRLFQGDDKRMLAARATADIVDALVSAHAQRDVSALGQALQLLRVDPLGRDSFPTVAAFALNDAIQQSFDANDLGAVFQGLALIDFTVRTNQHHEWLRSAFGMLTFNNRQILLSPSVQRMVWAYASKDELIKERYIEILQDFIAQSVDVGEADSATIFLRELVQLQPDPSRKNDEARLFVAEALSRQGRDVESQRVLSAVSTGIPLAYRLRMALGDLRFVVVILGALGGTGILGLIIVTWRRKKKVTPQKDESVVREDPMSRMSEGGRERDFVAYARDPLLGEEFSEYRECLSLFGLIEGVKLAEIKAAYRNTVKSCHPDLNPHASKEDAQRFIDLTKAYDRLLVLHKERFKGETA